MRVLYLDILFLVNFCMDYIALYVAGGLCERVRSARRLIASSFLGAVYAMAAVLLTGNEILQNLIGFCVALLLVALAYGRTNRRDFLRIFITFYAVSLLLGALVTVGYSMLNLYIAPDGIDAGKGRPLVFFAVAAVGALLIRLAGKWLSREGNVKNKRVTVKLGQKTVAFSALLDSGNRLCAPLSGRRVIVVGANVLTTFLPRELRLMLKNDPPDPSSLPPSLARRIRLIPVHTLSEVRLLIGFLPDEITVCDEGKGKSTRVDAIIAIDTGKDQNYGGYDAVMPTGLAA